MNRPFFYSLLFFLLIGCQPSIPRNILRPEKMRSVLWDMMRADEMASYYASANPSFHLYDTSLVYYQEVLQVHRITKQEFKTSLDYYEGHPALLKEVLDSLQAIGDRIPKQKDSTKPRLSPAPDSQKLKDRH
jgi:hypothetical protein